MPGRYFGAPAVQDQSGAILANAIGGAFQNYFGAKRQKKIEAQQAEDRGIEQAQAGVRGGFVSDADALVSGQQIPLPNDAHGQPRYLDESQTPEARQTARQQARADFQRKLAESVYKGAGASEGDAAMYALNPAIAAERFKPQPPVKDAGVGTLYQVAGPDGKPVYRAAADAIGQPAYHDPKAPTDKPSRGVVVQGEGGTFLVDPTDGSSQAVTGPGGGQLQPKEDGTTKRLVASNRAQLSKIDRALAAVAAHPQAVGMKRGIPVVGDAINQRVDPEGVDARANLADIGSLVLHDRSGAAVTVSEWPRLAPFVPKMTDTPETIRRKLTHLRAAIEEETNYLAPASSGVTAPQRPTTAVDPVLAKYGLTP